MRIDETQSRTSGREDTSATRRVSYVRDIRDVEQIPDDEREKLAEVAETFVFRANDYYLDLIDWDDENDPIRRLIIPTVEELCEWGALDASNEASNTVIPGVQHKYADTALLLAVEACGGYCRYCFRKRLFMRDNHEVSRDLDAGIDYIADHAEITDVLLTGGDPLLLSTDKLAQTLTRLREIPHVRQIRIGTKMFAFDPFRILDDRDLQELILDESGVGGRIYFMCHFDHPREFTEPAMEAVDRVRRLGAMAVNQCPIVAGVNDDAAVLHELFETTAAVGCPQYYLFQGRPTAGNEPYEVPIVRGWQLMSEARRGASGLARRARFSMSHETGKIEICGVDEEHIYTRYHRAKDPADEDRFMIFRRDDDAFWLDQLQPAT
jgi:KamA family protein